MDYRRLTALGVNSRKGVSHAVTAVSSAAKLQRGFAQSGFNNDLSDTRFYNFGGVSGFNQSLSDTELYTFSIGTSGRVTASRNF